MLILSLKKKKKNLVQPEDGGSRCSMWCGDTSKQEEGEEEEERLWVKVHGRDDASH